MSNILDFEVNKAYQVRNVYDSRIRDTLEDYNDRAFGRNILHMANDDLMAPDKKKVAGVKKEYVPDPLVCQRVEDILLKIRVKLLILQPFWGQLACQLQIQDASGWIPTAATDGRMFYYNVDFIQSLTDQELVFLFAHEILHVAYGHMMRRNSRQPMLWNAAADYAINGELVYAKVGEMPKCGLFSKDFLEFDKSNDFKGTWNSERIYDHLFDHAEKKGYSLETLDVHLDPEDTGQGEGDGEDGDGENPGGGYTPGDENNAPKISEAEMRRIEAEMKNSIIQAAAAEMSNPSKAAGTMPAGLRRLIKSWTEPKIKWTDLIDLNLKSQIKYDHTYMRPHRRGELEGGIIMPGWDCEDMIKAHVAIDTSGSMSDQMLKEICSELKGIMDQFATYELHIWCFDGKVHPKSYLMFTNENIENIEDYVLLGGGGTDFMVNWKFMRDREMEPYILLFFTDGYPCGEWGEPNYCDTIFCIHGDLDKRLKAPFGLTVWYEDAKRAK